MSIEQIKEIREICERGIRICESASHMSSEWVMAEFESIIERCDDSLQTKLDLDNIDDDGA